MHGVFSMWVRAQRSSKSFTVVVEFGMIIIMIDYN